MTDQKLYQFYNWTNTTKLILPFLFENRKYIDRQWYGFINAFNEDVNKPYLENKIFLVYKYQTEHIVDIELYCRMNKCYFSAYTTIIDDIIYEIFVFTIPTEYIKTIKLIQKGFTYSISNSNKDIISKFWNGSYININKHVFIKPEILKDIGIKKEQIPESDYMIEPWEMLFANINNCTTKGAVCEDSTLFLF